MTSPADLESQIASLSQQVAELRSLLGARGHAPEDVRVSDRSTEPRVSRRGLLTSIPVLAAAGAGAMALSGLAASPAAASPGDPVLQGMSNDQGASTTTIKATNAIALDVTTGVKSKTLHVGDGTLNDDGDLSVLTNPQYTAFVDCRRQINASTGDKGGSAIHADGFMAPAIVVDATDGHPKGKSAPTVVQPGLGIVVRGHGQSTGIEVGTQHAPVFLGVQTETKTKVSAATIITHGLSHGLVVEAVNTGNAQSALVGAMAGPGVAVVGAGSPRGRGGSFAGGAAQARLVPNLKAASHPAVGLAGDLFVDGKLRLWFCKGGATWALIV
jgi:hypothetical protein